MHTTNIRHVAHLHIHVASAAALQGLEQGEPLTGTAIAPQPGMPAPAPMAAAAASAPPSTLTPPAPGTAWPGQGGIYLCTLPAQFGLPARHLIAATRENDELAWGGYDHDSTGANSQTDGRANTLALLAEGKDHPAAKWASEYAEDGHADYFLPSRFDLFMAWLSAPQVFSKSGWYWSSSQYSRGSAFIQGFEYGDASYGGKGYEYRVRPVRTIHLL